MAAQGRPSRWFRPAAAEDAPLAARVTPAEAGWRYLGFEVRRFAAGETWQAPALDQREQGLVLLGGVCGVRTPDQTWEDLGRRSNVWSGLPWALYLPPRTPFTLEARTPVLLALGSSLAVGRHPAKLVRPADVEVEVRGGGNATRQINHIFKPDFPAERLLIVEVYTPAGSWSSYPPHKHDEHAPPDEVILEEVYYYQVERASGCAIQRLYSADGDLNETYCAGNGDLVLVPRGYHPVVATPESRVYYLNVLAGDERSMAARDEPALAWIRQTWTPESKQITLVSEPEG